MIYTATCFHPVVVVPLLRLAINADAKKRIENRQTKSPDAPPRMKRNKTPGENTTRRGKSSSKITTPIHPGKSVIETFLGLHRRLEFFWVPPVLKRLPLRAQTSSSRFVSSCFGFIPTAFQSFPSPTRTGLEF